MMTAAAITSRKSDIIVGTRDIEEPARKGREPSTLPCEQMVHLTLEGAGDPVIWLIGAGAGHHVIVAHALPTLRCVSLNWEESSRSRNRKWWGVLPTRGSRPPPGILVETEVNGSSSWPKVVSPSFKSLVLDPESLWVFSIYWTSRSFQYTSKKISFNNNTVSLGSF